jgi:exodeoxyribonuclease-3
MNQGESAAPKSTFLRFLTYNILDGGQGRERELTEILAAQDADIIVLQEVVGREFVTGLAAQLKANYFIAESNSWRTIALVTRLAIENVTVFRPMILRHTCLQATLTCAPNKTLTVFGIHLGAPAYTLPVELRRLSELKAILGQVRASGAERVIVAGDFNSIAPGDSPALKHLPLSLRFSIFVQGGYVARQVIGNIRAQGFTDAFREMHPNDAGYTFPTWQPNTRLDYIFVNEALRGAVSSCEVIQTPREIPCASDHLPVRLDLALA